MTDASDGKPSVSDHGCGRFLRLRDEHIRVHTQYIVGCFMGCLVPRIVEGLCCRRCRRDARALRRCPFPFISGNSLSSVQAVDEAADFDLTRSGALNPDEPSGSHAYVEDHHASCVMCHEPSLVRIYHGTNQGSHVNKPRRTGVFHLGVVLPPWPGVRRRDENHQGFVPVLCGP